MDKDARTFTLEVRCLPTIVGLFTSAPPGAGKTMLARRLPTILPSLTLDEALETTKIHFRLQLGPNDEIMEFRHPQFVAATTLLLKTYGTVFLPGELERELRSASLRIAPGGMGSG